MRSHLKTIFEHVKPAVAFTRRCYGSVDRTQVNKLFVMLKLVNGSAQVKLVFVGAKEPKEKGAGRVSS